MNYVLILGRVKVDSNAEDSGVEALSRDREEEDWRGDICMHDQHM